MKVLKEVFDFYIHSSIHVALAVVSMAWVTFLKFAMPLDVSLLLFIFFASITGYNFVKYFGLAKFHHRSLARWLKVIQVFSMICFLMMCYFAIQLPIDTIIYIAAFGVVTFLYAVPFLPTYLFMDSQKNLRNIGGLKVYVIATVWAGVTVLLPLLHAKHSLDVDVWLTAIQRFMVVVVLMLPFEIRDLQYDSLKLSTIPQKIGIRKTKVMGIFLSLLFFILEFLKDDLSPQEIPISLIISLIMMLFLMASRKDQSKYYSSFFVESVPVLWLLLHFVF